MHIQHVCTLKNSLLTLACAAAFSPAFVYATPSGLSNIPTADAIFHRNVAVQAKLNFVFKF